MVDPQKLVKNCLNAKQKSEIKMVETRMKQKLEINKDLKSQ